jgi:tRNA(Ile)-lysidine synthase
MATGRRLSAIDPAAVDRLRADLARLWPEAEDGAGFGVAVSGGADSLALLLLASAALPGRVIATTVDHGLRADAADEARMVARLCAGLGVVHETVTVSVEPGNLQDRARDARYAALCSAFGKHGADVFATAHHADDQAETVLMRLNRGSGLNGLAGIRARRIVGSDASPGECLVVRPLLHWRREELARIVAAAGIDPVRDPSNDDDRFERVRMRRALARAPWLDPLAIARSAEYLQDAERTVDDAVIDVVRRCVVWEECGIAFFHWGHSRHVETEVVGTILHDLGTAAPRSAIARMVEQLRSDGHATLGGVMARRTMHRTDPLTQMDAWRFEREPPRRTG